MTEEHKQKISKSLQGRKLTLIHKKRVGNAMRGRKLTKNHRAKIGKTLKERGIKPPTMYGKDNPNWGKKMSKEQREKIRKKRTGWKAPIELRRKMSETRRGSKSPGWKGGITALQTRIRNTVKYAEWRQQCFLRDDFLCQKCNQKGGKLEVHHIKRYSALLQEAKNYLPLFDWYNACLLYTPLWDIKNGVTLCIKCHKKSHKRT